MLATITVILALANQAFATGTPYGSGSYGSGTYNGTAPASSGGNSGSNQASSSSSSNATGGGTSTGSNSGHKNPSPTPTLPTTGGESNPTTPTPVTASQNRSTKWLVAGIAVVLLAISLFIWLAIRRHRRHDGRP